MEAAHAAPGPQEPIVDLVPVVRRVVAARVADHALREDIVQETLARVMASRSRIEHDSLVPYAVVTARNLIASTVKQAQSVRRVAHLLVEDDLEPRPDDGLLRREQAAMMETAMARLPAAERDVLLAHEVEGLDTATLAARRGSTPGAVAAQLNRTRSRLRVEYLVTRSGVEPPTDRCRPVLVAVSLGDRRRQRELDTSGHLLSCDFCARLAPGLTAHRPRRVDPDEVTVAVARDVDVVLARQRAREVAAGARFTGSDLTVVATAVSEIARNIVRFARRGEVTFTVLTDDGRTGVRVTARDGGPGIPDVARALRDGYSTYRGLGLGLPGARRLMDEFEVVSEVGKGTTVTMTKWRP